MQPEPAVMGKFDWRADRQRLRGAVMMQAERPDQARDRRFHRHGRQRLGDVRVMFSQYDLPRRQLHGAPSPTPVEPGYRRCQREKLRSRPFARVTDSITALLQFNVADALPCAYSAARPVAACSASLL